MAANMESGTLDEYKFLATRAKFHEKIFEEGDVSTKKNRKTRYLLKFFTCHNHNSAGIECSECVSFPVQEQLPSTRLPTGLQFLGYIFYLNSVTENCGKKNVIPDVVADVMYHWISCNLYTTTRRSVTNKLEKLLNAYNSLKKTPQKKKGPTYSTSLKEFAMNCENLFDIRCTDKSRLSIQEAIWKVKETKMERDFYAGQCKVPQEGHCTKRVDPGWVKTTLRKKKDGEGLEKRRKEEMSVNDVNYDVFDETHSEVEDIDAIIR